MLKQLINQIRHDYGQPRANFPDAREDEYCKWHCQHMAGINQCCHAPDELRNGKSEAVGVAWTFQYEYDAIKEIICEGFLNSVEHRSVILFSQNLACAFYKYYDRLYVTIRGW